MKILVTGGAGFIGNSIVQALMQENHEVIIFDINVWDHTEDGISYIKGDIFDLKQLRETSSDCDSIIHMIGLPDARAAQKSPQLSFNLNVRSFQYILEAMRETKVSSLVVPSSAAVYGAVEKSPVSEETTPKLAGIYAYHKYIVEKMAEAYSSSFALNITVLRLFNVYGDKGSGIINILLEKARGEEAVRLFGEKQKRDFIHISEASDAFAKAVGITNGFNIYNIGTGTGRSIQDIVELVKEHIPTLKVEYGQSSGVLYDSVADITKFQSATGFSPDQSSNTLINFTRSYAAK